MKDYENYENWSDEYEDDFESKGSRLSGSFKTIRPRCAKAASASATP